MINNIDNFIFLILAWRSWPISKFMLDTYKTHVSVYNISLDKKKSFNISEKVQYQFTFCTLTVSYFKLNWPKIKFHTSKNYNTSKTL